MYDYTGNDFKVNTKDTNESSGVLVNLSVDNVILVRKSKKLDIRYIQIQIHKSPRGRNINEESSERISPDDSNENEIKFSFPKEHSSFELKFRRDILPEIDQFEIDVLIMLGNTKKQIGCFGLCLDDVNPTSSDKKKIRSIKSIVKEIQDIEIKFKLNVINNSNNNKTATGLDTSDFPQKIQNGELSANDGNSDAIPALSEDLDQTVPNFQPNSCIIVLGTTGRGKTTTMNLYTGNTAKTGAASHGTTMTNDVYIDQRPGYPVWLDTVGLDESGAASSNGDLVRYGCPIL